MTTKWVEKQILGPYDGALFVFNFGRKNYKTIPNLTQEYVDMVQDAVGKAHAAGLAVFYLFDNEIEYSMPPEEFDYREDYDHVRPICVYGGNLNLPLDYNRRVQELHHIASEVYKDTSFMFARRHSRFVGHVHIMGDPVLIPLTC
jgi:hypothetical protein